MNQQEFDARSIRLKSEMTQGLAEIRKERDIDLHNHNKALSKIALRIAERADATLVEVRQLLLDGYFERDQHRKDREDRINAEFAKRKAELIAEYSQWVGSRKSNREANRELWISQHKQIQDE